MKARDRFTRFVIVGFLCMLVPGYFARAEAALWPHDESDLKPDPVVTWGMLENGFRFAVMPNKEPPEKVSLRLYVDAGSLMEEDDQRGLAHFLEHMAFNGSRNFSEGDLVEYLQRLGMGFGADTNAHTSWKETVYYLEIPRNDEETLREGLQVFRDYADGLLLDEEEIEKERGVILSEKRARDSVRFRLYKDELGFLFPDTLLPGRITIGEEAVIENAGRERFVDFYRNWYSSDRMVLVAVGDIQPGSVEPLIEEYFSSLVAPSETRPDPEIGEIVGTGIKVHISREPEASSTTVSIQTLRPYTPQPDTFDRRRRNLHRVVAVSVINRRLEILSKEEGASFRSASTFAYDWLDFVEIAGIELRTRPELWREAMNTAEKELRRALAFGFTEPELEEAKANILNSFEQNVKAAPTRQSRGLAGALTASISGNDVFTSPEDDLEAVRRSLVSADAENCLAELRGAWEGGNLYLLVAGNVTLERAEETILTAYRSSRQEKVEPPQEVIQKAFAYGGSGESGVVTESSTDSKLDVEQIRFQNGVRLNLKKTDFEKNAIHLLVRFGGGMLTAPEELPGLPLLASATFTAGGLGEHSSDELSRLFAGKTVGINFTVQDDAFILAGSTGPEDLFEQLLMMRAFLTDPGYRVESIRQAHKHFERLYLQSKQTLRGVMQNEVALFLRSGDARFGLPVRSLLFERTLDEVKIWLGPYLKSSYMEVSIVGDFDPEETLSLVSQTFGTLPTRDDSKPAYLAARRVSFPGSDSKRTFSVATEIPKAITAVYWPTDDIWDISRTRRLNLLAAVLNDRMRIRIREDLGEAYSPRASSLPSDTFAHYGYLAAITITDPLQAERVITAMKEIANNLKKEGVSQDELDRALKPLLNGLKEWVRNNDYWLGTVMGSSQEYPERLEWSRSMVDDFQSISVEDVNRLAEQYIGGHHGVEVIVTPAGPVVEE